ncbi:Predicted membrane protein [[Eubacterium] contortum]|uniref:Predicted membrane protein n=1 Tax=Faecalicatena contorta TaxID=39482 RepID=A0A174N5P6_9FIRM|nr:DUF2335 domain-containing protein [Faecalicatena contorta]CUP44074.1 Predicted membrane protein [[Eubacterium] contortum] [Faecalicatena contorta]
MSENQSEKKQEILEAPDVEVEEKEKEQVRQVVAEVIRSEFSGPIPPPSIIKGYEEILPGSADRILAMAEKQSDHRQEMERKIVNTEARDSLLGILFAFMLGFGCILAAVVMVILVPKSAGVISGAVLGVTGIGSIIATFIKSTRGSYGRKKEERKNQNSENSI